jgi:uncharacterized protein GlcG (DUF336 family)
MRPKLRESHFTNTQRHLKKDIAMLTIRRLSLADARTLIAGAGAHAEKIGIPMCIAVTDEQGQLIAFERMDGAKFTSIAIAQDKAFTAAGIRRGTDQLGQIAHSGSPAFGINTANGGRMMILGGGLPIVVDGEVVGAIGLSSGTADQDKECAEAGIAALQATFA